MSDTAAKTLRKVPELPKIRGKASEVLAAEPKASLRQLAADNTDKKTLKNISGILDKFVSYSRTPADRTTDITIRTVQEETAEALETTSRIISLSTKHLEEQNKTLEDILKLLRTRSKKESDATGDGSILGSLLDLLDYDGGRKSKKQRRYSSEREKKARQRLRQMRRQRMIRKLTRPFQRPTAPTITPPATSVTKPPVTPARPTVPEVNKTPVTPEPEAKKTYKTEFDKSGKPRYRDIETGRFIKDPTKPVTKPDVTTTKPVAPEAPKPVAPKPVTPEAPKPVAPKPVAPEAPKPVAPEAPKPVAPEAPKPVAKPDVTKIEQPKIPGKDATKVTGQAAKKLSGLKLGGAVLTVIEGLSLMTDLDQIEHEYTIGEINKEQYKQRYGSTIGSFLGGTAGGAVLGSIGAVLGAPLLGVGSVVFGVLGGVAGTFAGSAIGSWIGETVASELMGDTPPKPPSPRAMTTKDQEDIRSMLQDKEFVSSLDPKVVKVLEIISDKEQVDLKSNVKARGAKNILEGLIQENKEAFAKAYRKKETTQDKPDATPAPQVQAAPVAQVPAIPVAQVPATPAAPVAQATPPQGPQVQPTPQSESIDRNKLIDRLKTVSSKITDKDEKTVNRLENITRMIQNNELSEASAAIERMEKQVSSTQEKPLSEAFRERQNRPQTAPDAQRQRQSSTTDGSYQVASAQTTMTDAIPVAYEETESKPTTKKADDADNTKISNQKEMDDLERLLTGKSSKNINDVAETPKASTQQTTEVTRITPETKTIEASKASAQQTTTTQKIKTNTSDEAADLRLLLETAVADRKDEETTKRAEVIRKLIDKGEYTKASADITKLSNTVDTKDSKAISTDIFGTSTDIKQETTATSDAKPITSEPVVKLASDISAAGEKIVDPTKTTTKVINETVNDINGGQITKATNTVEKLTSEVKEQNKLYETLNDAMSLLGFKKDVTKQTEQSKDIEQEKPETPTATPQAQAIQNIQQMQAQVAQAPVSSKFSSGFSKMAGLAAGFMGASAATAAVGGSTGGANRIAAGTLGTVGGAAVMGAMMQPQNLGAFGSILSGGTSSPSASNISGSTATGQTPQATPVNPQGGAQPSGDFMTEVGKVASNLGIDASNLIAIMKSESSLNPQAVNPVTGASGLIQFMPNTAKSLGTTVEEIRKMTAVQQLPYVEKYFKSVRVQPGSSAGRLYAYVFLPGRANREVLTQAGENYYESNKGLDVDRDGKITIADLDARLAKYGGSVSASLQPSRPSTGPSLSAGGTSMEAADQAQMRSAGQALQGTTTPAPSTGPQGMQMPVAAAGMGEIPINIRLRQLQS